MAEPGAGISPYPPHYPSNPPSYRGVGPVSSAHPSISSTLTSHEQLQQRSPVGVGGAPLGVSMAQVGVGVAPVGVGVAPVGSSVGVGGPSVGVGGALSSSGVAPLAQPLQQPVGM